MSCHSASKPLNYRLSSFVTIPCIYTFQKPSDALLRIISKAGTSYCMTQFYHHPHFVPFEVADGCHSTIRQYIIQKCRVASLLALKNQHTSFEQLPLSPPSTFFFWNNSFMFETSKTSPNRMLRAKQVQKGERMLPPILPPFVGYHIQWNVGAFVECVNGHLCLHICAKRASLDSIQCPSPPLPDPLFPQALCGAVNSFSGKVSEAKWLIFSSNGSLSSSCSSMLAIISSPGEEWI